MRVLFVFLFFHFHFPETLSAPISEYRALLSLRSVITDATPPVLSSWNASIPYCSWLGVTCDNRRHVTALNLTGLDLSGTLSADISSQMRLAWPCYFQLHSSNNFFLKVKCLSPLSCHHLILGFVTCWVCCLCLLEQTSRINSMLRIKTLLESPSNPYNFF